MNKWCPTCAGEGTLLDGVFVCSQNHIWHICPVHKVVVAGDPGQIGAGCTCHLPYQNHHRQLHRSLRLLMSEFVRATGCDPQETAVSELAQWAEAQTTAPPRPRHHGRWCDQNQSRQK